MPDDSERHDIRRQHQRRNGPASALLHVRKQFQTVKVADFSEGGVQLQGAFGVLAGDRIVLDLVSGERCEIKVMWSLGSRLGGRFLTPLDADDPVLAALQRAAERPSALRKRSGGDVPAAA